MGKQHINVNSVTKGPLHYTATTALDALKHIQNSEKCNRNVLLMTHLYSNEHSR